MVERKQRVMKLLKILTNWEADIVGFFEALLIRKVTKGSFFFLFFVVNKPANKNI